MATTKAGATVTTYNGVDLVVHSHNGGQQTAVMFLEAGRSRNGGFGDRTADDQQPWLWRPCWIRTY